MGRAPQHDGPERLTVSAALGRFTDQVTQLARTPVGFAAGFVVARAECLAVVTELEHRAALVGNPARTQQARAARFQVESALLEIQGDPALLRVLTADPEPCDRHLQRDFEDAGARLSPEHRRTLAGVHHRLHEATEAFARHTTQGAPLRAEVRHSRDAQAREAAWTAAHHHASGAAPLCLDILRLRRTWAQTLGFSDYATWVDRDTVFGDPTVTWLAPMAQALVSRARRTAPLAPWNRNPPPGETGGVDRDGLVRRLADLLSGAGIRVAFDVVGRADKHPGAWTSVTTDGITVCASLPETLDHRGVRTLLHECGHAAEAALGSSPRPPAADLVEFASTLFERHATLPATRESLGLDGPIPTPRPRETLRHVALAHVDRLLHASFDPASDGSPLPWARRAFARIEAEPRDPRDATVATHLHLFGRPHGYAARYRAYPLGDALAEHWVAAHPDEALDAALARLARHVESDEGRRDPISALCRATGQPPGPVAHVRAVLAQPR